MALPTTPTPKAASTDSGKTQKTSMLLIGSTLRRSDLDPPRPEVYVWHVLEGKGKIQILPVFLFTDHEDLVGGGLEGLHHGSDDLSSVAHGRQADQIGHIELSFFGRVELLTLEQKLTAPQGIRVVPIREAIEV